MFMKKELGINGLFAVVFILLSFGLFGQVYNLYPIGYYDFEVNPSALTSGDLHKRYQLISAGSFNGYNPIFTTNIRYSKLLFSSFSGVGVTLSHTSVGAESYSSTALSYGYRTVLFDELFLRLGATYKFIYTNSHEGAFDYYSFMETPSKRSQAIHDNVNLSIALTNGYGQYYLTYSYLNSPLPWNLSDKELFFPRYHLITAGNFLSFFTHEPIPELSYTGLLKKSHGSNKLELSQYLNMKFKTNYNRKISIRYGGSVGLVDSKYIHLVPLIGYYTQKLSVNFLYSIHFKNYDIHPDYTPSSQLNIIYLIWKKNHRSRF